MGGSSSKVHGGEEMGGAVHLWEGGHSYLGGSLWSWGAPAVTVGRGSLFILGGPPSYLGMGGFTTLGGGAPIVFGEIIFYLGKGPISGGGGVEKLAVQQLKGGGGCPMGGRGVLPLPPPLPPH